MNVLLSHQAIHFVQLFAELGFSRGYVNTINTMGNGESSCELKKWFWYMISFSGGQSILFTCFYDTFCATKI